MRIKHMKKTLPAAALALFCTWAWAGGKKHPAVEFSADVEEISEKMPENNYKGHLYVTPDWLRDEGESNGVPEITIYHFSDARLWSLKPEQKKYLETHPVTFPHPLDEATGEPCKNNPEANCVFLGEEKHEGREARKWRVVAKEAGQEVVSTQWYDKKLKILVRDERDDGSRFVLHHLKEGKLLPALFELPAGYEKAEVEIPQKMLDAR